MSVCLDEQTQAGVNLCTVGKKVEIKPQRILKGQVKSMTFMS